ncbi:MAG: alpha/beta fold hydrolase [Actinobacteria bacterium]|nr:alpha/beta fold hydrolase [Actinomycetota bacterium]
MFDVYEGCRTVTNGGVTLTVTDHGPRDGVPVLMVHGFPDSARLWRHQIPVLVEHGYRVIAPDLRGYGRSDKPQAVEDCAITVLAGDMTAILDDAGVERAHYVGHDWGSALGWFFATTQPQRVRSLVALSAGHAGGFDAAGVVQREKTWYILFFLIEGLAERRLPEDDWYWFRSWIGRHPEIETWIADLSRPGALTAALNIYRANINPESWIRPARDHPKVTVPTMGVWSSKDLALTETQMTASEEYVAGEWRYERIEGASHWIPLDAPDELNRILLDWLSFH